MKGWIWLSCLCFFILANSHSELLFQTVVPKRLAKSLKNNCESIHLSVKLQTEGLQLT